MAWRLLLALVALAAASRSRAPLDIGWKFLQIGPDLAECSDKDFPEDLEYQWCHGLTQHAEVTAEDWCRATCCGDDDCEVWQWCPAGSVFCSPAASCWTGRKTTCVRGAAHWHGRGRTVHPTPAPAPGTSCDSPYCEVGFDDAAWRTLDLPHDFVLEGNFTPQGSMSHGYLPFGKAWYRLRFEVPDVARLQSVWLEFEGVQRNSIAYLNGVAIGSHLSGYTPFRYDISQAANFGGQNILAVSVDATKPDGWWYDGGGIYRHVWLATAAKVHVAPWGVYLPASVVGPVGDDLTAPAQVHVQTTIVNEGDVPVSLWAESEIRDPSGALVATLTSDSVMLGGDSNHTLSMSASIASAQLWSLETPRLYQCKTTVLTGSPDHKEELDVVTHSFGIRSIRFDKDKGFFLNDQAVKIKGFANHQDFAGVGVAVPDSLQGFRVWKQKQMGSNAWRTAHNPPNTALLDECDRQGMLVWDENHRNRATPDMVEDLRSLILRDRNHPSVIMWSICNEALCEDWDIKSARVLRSVFKELDPLGQRPVTAAMNGGYGLEFQDVLDVMGINYHIGLYDVLHRSRPNQPMIASETSSDYSDRSVYQNDPVTKKYVSAYDVNYPPWGSTAEDAWCAIADRDYMAGGFYWTAFDYKGEPTPYGWPNVNSHFGVIDIAGFPKDNFYYHQSVFLSFEEQPMVHLLPHWNWESGKKVKVWAYTNGDSVELFLNSRSQGRKPAPPCRHVEWEVSFEAGELRAQAYSTHTDGVVASDAVSTTGEAAAIDLSIEWPLSGSLQVGAADTALVTARLVDAEGRLVTTAAAPLIFDLSGPGKILGLGNGDPSSHEPDRPTSPLHGARSAWNGLARVVLQASGSAGPLHLSARVAGGGLRQASLEIPVAIGGAARQGPGETAVLI